MEKLIERYKSLRKKSAIQRSYAGKYAFVGIGNHSLNNLYPVIDYLKIPLKYIVCKSEQTAALVNANYPNVVGTTDYEAVLRDEEIIGVFICTAPAAHFALAKRALEAGKRVFAEKPVCLSSAELLELAALEKEGKVLAAGMQKRFSTCTAILKKEMRKVISYNYRFRVGAYPEGNAVWDIFIHPVDLACYLFGEAEIVSCVKTAGSVFLHLRHKGGAIGALELSTEYAWSQAVEELSINTESGVYEMKDHLQLTFSAKPKKVAGIPTEKVFPHTPEVKILFNGSNFLPAFGNNQLVSQGFFGEIEAFVNEKKNIAVPSSLMNTYKILEEIDL
ncbi:MAG: Gfo/Idh/MocA family oxidoreductase [Prevotellaceae bacterium]|jgi:virulence factor|nr:Gfo/Idh/MocA family oxidoreductase [Prevotellaceae bacterium]